MIGLIVAAGLGLALLSRMSQKPGLTEVNPQPVPLTPRPNTVGLVVAAVQPQIEQSRGAIVAAPIPYQPATTMVPDIGQLKENLGPITNTDPSLIANSSPQTPVATTKAVQNLEITSSLLAITEIL